MFAFRATAADCSARSGPDTAALVELYTSAGCPACRAAERRLGALEGPPRIVFLVIPYELVPAPPPRRLTPGQRLALTPAPRVLLQGEAFDEWGTAAFDDAVERILARPARARLELRIARSGADRLRLRASAELLDPAQIRHSALYVAAYSPPEKRVLQWDGPARFSGARLELERSLPLPAGTGAADSGAAAFVQNRRTGEVLQALSLTTCP